MSHHRQDFGRRSPFPWDSYSSDLQDESGATSSYDRDSFDSNYSWSRDRHSHEYKARNKDCLVNERLRRNNFPLSQVLPSISPQRPSPYWPADNYQTTNSVNNCQPLTSYSPTSQPRHQYHYQTQFGPYKTPAPHWKEPLIRELSLSPPKPPSAFITYSRDLSVEETRETDSDGVLETRGQLQVHPSSRPLSREKRAIHSCPPSPRPYPHNLNRPRLAVTSPAEQTLTDWQTAYQEFCYPDRSVSGQSCSIPMSSGRQSRSFEAERLPALALEGNELDEFTQTSTSCVGGREVTSTHVSVIKKNQRAAEDSSQSKQESSHSPTPLLDSHRSASPNTSSVKGGTGNDKHSGSDPVQEYKAWAKFLLPQKLNSSSVTRGHRPLTQTRSAERDSEEQMVRQGSDKRLFLAPSAAEQGVQSARLPQRSRSLRISPSSQQKRASFAQKGTPPAPAAPIQARSESGRDKADALLRDRTGSMPESTKLLNPQKLPSVTGRGGSFRTKRDKSTPKRLDEWPQPEVNMHTQRFLQLPDADEYARLRSFTIDEKGCVISRGDSFRLRSNTKSTSSGSNSDRDLSPRSGSPDLAETGRDKPRGTPAFGLDSEDSDCGVGSEQCQRPEKSYEVVVLGSEGCGKTALINQFMTSEHRNPFSTELDNPSEDIVSIVIEGQESELKFREIDPEKDEDMWLSAPMSAYLVLYSVDSKASFKYATGCISDLRERRETARAPIILAGNKIDLARKRVVHTQEARTASQSFRCDHYEFSVALNHGVDEILVGILAEINRDPHRPTAEAADGFRLSISRFSQRKKRQNSASKKRSSQHGKRDESKSPRDSKKETKKTGRKKEENGKTSPSGKISGGFSGFMNKLLKRHGSGSCENNL